MAYTQIAYPSISTFYFWNVAVFNILLLETSSETPMISGFQDRCLTYTS